MKKIIALISAAFLILSFFASTVYAAEESDKMTKQEYLAAQHWLIGQYCDRKITYEQYMEQSQAVTDEFYSDNTVGDTVMTWASNIGNTCQAIGNKIGATVDQYGDAAVDVINSSLSGLMSDYRTSTQVPSTDLNGYGALMVRSFEFSPTDISYTYFYCNYVEVYSDNGETICRVVGPYVTYDPKTGKYSDVNSWSHNQKLNDGIIHVTSLVGDIRYLDDNGNPYLDENGNYIDGDSIVNIRPEFPPSSDGTVTEEDYDFTPATEQELIDLLDEVNEELENLNPDLSTSDGILKSIYYRLGKIDSDNDNELLSQILTAIKSIKGNSDNEKLLKILEEIKKSLVYEDGENSVTLAEELKQIIDNQLTVDDFTIDEKLQNNNSEILKLRLLGKFSFINELKEFVTYIFNTYKNSSDTPEISVEIFDKTYKIEMEIFKDYLPLIQSIIAAFVYISYAYHTYRKMPSYINGGDNE